MRETYCFFTFLLLFSLASSLFNEFHDNIIIGAGIAGIGASMVLSNNSARHLLIQARNRIGGRITPFYFANTLQELGAAFIQLPKQNNKVDPFVSTFNITKIPAHFDSETNWYVNKTICSANDLDNADNVFVSLLNYINNRINSLPADVAVSQIVRQYWDAHPEYKGFVKDRVNLKMQFIALDNGAQLYNISTRQFFTGDGYEYKDDYAPIIGYSALIERIFKTYCSPTLHLNERVLKIEYTGFIIIVTTNLGTYTTNKLFIAVPLGILKAGQIQFSPPLPQDKARAISSIGFGYFQKLFVTFSGAFWPKNSSTLHFIGKDRPNKYVQAWVVPPAFAHGLNMLIFWIAGDAARQLTTLTLDQIKEDMMATLANYIPQSVVITNLYLTNWKEDPYTLGSYSYAKVGTPNQDFVNMKSVLKRLFNRIWFIGEYVDPQQYSFSHGAFKTGVEAAKKSLELN